MRASILFVFYLITPVATTISLLLFAYNLHLFHKRLKTMEEAVILIMHVQAALTAREKELPPEFWGMMEKARAEHDMEAIGVTVMFGKGTADVAFGPSRN